jgi:hypothetical protein
VQTAIGLGGFDSSTAHFFDAGGDLAFPRSLRASDRWAPTAFVASSMRCSSRASTRLTTSSSS